MLYDTNILIDQLKGVPQATEELRHSIDLYISIVTWVEVLAGANFAIRRNQAAPDACQLRHPSPHASDRRAHSRSPPRTQSPQTPDAIILATAQVHTLTLVTRNTRDFLSSDPGVRIPYILYSSL